MRSKERRTAVLALLTPHSLLLTLKARSQANSRAHGARGSCAAQGRQIARGTDSLDTTSTQSPQHNAPHWAHGPAATAWQ